jgi:arylsulfatase A-like enzyme
MNRIFALGICLLILTFNSPAYAAGSKPNVLFLICDDLNNDLSSYGHPIVKSPNLDRLAARGVQFNQAYCQMPFCGPSRASFMTGLYPDQTLVKRNMVYIREHTPNVITLPQAFRKRGYFAARIGKIFHYNVPGEIGSGGYDDPSSWNQTINPRGRDLDDQRLIYSLVPGNTGGALCWLAADGEDREQTDGIAAEEAVELLERFARTDQSFFLAVGLYRPHLPFVAPKKYFDMYPLEDIEVPEVPRGYLDTVPEAVRSRFNRKPYEAVISEENAKRATQGFYASVSFADAQLGIVLDALDETGLADNTVVVFTSDHGYHLGEHGLWMKGTLFENSTRVPLIFAGPGVEAKGSKTDALAEMIDIYPTLAELAGVPSATLRDSALTQLGSGYTVRTSRYRYTRWGKGRGPANMELYDRESDPEELRNLIRDPNYAETVKKMSTLLDERIADAVEPPEGLIQNTYEFERIIPY